MLYRLVPEQFNIDLNFFFLDTKITHLKKLKKKLRKVKRKIQKNQSKTEFFSAGQIHIKLNSRFSIHIYIVYKSNYFFFIKFFLFHQYCVLEFLNLSVTKMYSDRWSNFQICLAAKQIKFFVRFKILHKNNRPAARQFSKLYSH